MIIKMESEEWMGERIKEEIVVFSTVRCCYTWVFEISVDIERVCGVYIALSITYVY